MLHQNHPFDNSMTPNSQWDSHIYDHPSRSHKYSNSSTSFSHVLMHTIKSHGELSKQNPFEASTNFDKTKPIAVITRANIKLKLAYQFWKNVPSVSKSMDNYKDLIFSKGIGEFTLLKIIKELRFLLEQLKK